MNREQQMYLCAESPAGKALRDFAKTLPLSLLRRVIIVNIILLWTLLEAPCNYRE